MTILAAPFLTNDVAKVLNVSPDTVRRLERAGILPALKTSSGVRLFSRADVERLARERAASQQPGAGSEHHRSQGGRRA
jgi:excisionase family DNA binding protein